jgi:hypothetical protein
MTRLPPALDPDGSEIRRLIAAAGDTVVCMGYTEAAASGPYTSAVPAPARSRARTGSPSATARGKSGKPIRVCTPERLAG